jgi:hypothetical protein
VEEVVEGRSEDEIASNAAVPRGSSEVWRSMDPGKAQYSGSTADWQNSIRAPAQRSWAKRQKPAQCQKDLPRTISTRYRVRATVNPSLLQGRQAHATAANTAITTTIVYCASWSRALNFQTFLPWPFLGPASLPLPTSCRSRRTRTHVCKPSRPSRGPAASAAACAFGCPRGRAKRPVLRRYALFMPRPRRKWLEWQAPKTSKWRCSGAAQGGLHKRHHAQQPA